MGLGPNEAGIQLDQVDFEVIALEMAEFTLKARDGVSLPNPLLYLEALGAGPAAGFYWGLIHDVPIPFTTQDIVERNLDAYAAGVLARELIDSGGQDDVYTKELAAL